MKVLLIKTSSLGDLIHCMPAVEDLANARPDIELHWLVEEGFVDVPSWHPFVKKVHAYANRRWRKSKFSKQTRQEVNALKAQLRAENFDVIVDAQGLLKSALVTRWLDVPSHGYDKRSIREPLASFFYSARHCVSRSLNAITRNRQLFAQVFDYATDQQLDGENTDPEFGLKVDAAEHVAQLQILGVDLTQPYVLLSHGTNWASKVYPTAQYIDVCLRLKAQNLAVLIPWYGEHEKARAQAIADQTHAQVLPKLDMNALAFLLQEAQLVIGSDTGFSHIAAAMATPTVAIYGASNSALTALQGKACASLQVSAPCTPCMQQVCPKIDDQSRIPCYESLPASHILESANALMNMGVVPMSTNQSNENPSCN